MSNDEFRKLVKEITARNFKIGLTDIEDNFNELMASDEAVALNLTNDQKQFFLHLLLVSSKTTNETATLSAFQLVEELMKKDEI